MSRKNAFVERHRIDPTGAGMLDGRTFAVKDLLAIEGKIAGSGNPTWGATHTPAEKHAKAVKQLLKSGGTCLGRTVTDELGFSLLGENAHFGTPLNPKAPGHVPGGSSSGSASAVAQGEVDLALGTDTGGSVRVPASNCGIWGFRPTHGRISTEGMHPFAPSFDTVGVLAQSAELLEIGSVVLLNDKQPSNASDHPIFVLTDAITGAEENVRRAVENAVSEISAHVGLNIQPISLDEIGVRTPLAEFHQHFCVLQWSEIWSSLGPWVEANSPRFGSGVAASMALAQSVDHDRIPESKLRREEISRDLNAWLGNGRSLLLPTTPTLAPRLGMDPRRDGANADYYPRTLSQTALAGLAGLPEVSMPLLEIGGLPMGLSLIGGKNQDRALLTLTRKMAEMPVSRQ